MIKQVGAFAVASETLKCLEMKTILCGAGKNRLKPDLCSLPVIFTNTLNLHYSQQA